MNNLQKIVYVTKKGKLTANKKGTAYITVSATIAANGKVSAIAEGSAVISVTVKPMKGKNMVLKCNMTVKNEETAIQSITITAAEAVLDGVTLKDTPNEKKIEYSEADSCIIGIGEFSTATYQTPAETKGTFDIYLNISKGSNAYVGGSTPVTVSVNGGSIYVPSVPVQPCSMDQMGMQGNPTYQNDMGLFLVKTNAELKGEDTITIGGVPGSEFLFNESYSISLPAIGDLVLYPAGTEVEQGYENNKFTNAAEKKNSSDPLSGLNIAWLGSSVTYGQGASGYSMADQIAANHSATNSYKYAISGTTLADCKYGASLPTDGEGSHGSYVYRMEQLDKTEKYDLFIVQLSTNDATNGIPMGEISADKELAHQNRRTVIGAMEYIIGYVCETWGCPVMFYTGTKYDSAQYAEMVDILLKLQEKWDIGVIDLWNNAQMNVIDQETYLTYMKEDGIHPLREGYVKWWTPVFEKEIADYLNKQKANVQYQSPYNQ